LEVPNRICEEDSEAKNLKYIEELAVMYEAYIKSATVDVNKIGDYKKRKKWEDKKTSRNNRNLEFGKEELAESTTTKRMTCHTCGRGNHEFMECRYKDLSCNICKAKGHLSKVFKKKSNNFKYQLC